MADLFPTLPESLSPRLQWLRDHGLTLHKLDNGKWECTLDAENFGRGDDPDEACADFCIKTGMAHWSAE